MKRLVFILFLSLTIFVGCASFKNEMVLKIALAETLARSSHVAEIHAVCEEILTAPEGYSSLIDLSNSIDEQIDAVFFSEAGRNYAKSLVKQFGQGVIDNIAADQVIDKVGQVDIALDYVQFVYGNTYPR